MAHRLKGAIVTWARLWGIQRTTPWPLRLYYTWRLWNQNGRGKWWVS